VDFKLSHLRIFVYCPLWTDCYIQLDAPSLQTQAVSYRAAEGGKSGETMADKSWIIWLTREGGETLLGLKPDNDNSYRFAVWAEFDSDGPNGIGAWVEVQLVHKVEITSTTILQSWTVTPASCLILWQHIAYVQRGEKSGKIGFTPTNSK
jgi:hypothetical protein